MLLIIAHFDINRYFVNLIVLWYNLEKKYSSVAFMNTGSAASVLTLCQLYSPHPSSCPPAHQKKSNATKIPAKQKISKVSETLGLWPGM